MHEVATGGWLEDIGSEGLQLRCITGFNSGPPMTPGYYNNNVQLFQTPEYVVLLNEMNHNTRIVPLDGRAHVDLRQWTPAAAGRAIRSSSRRHISSVRRALSLDKPMVGFGLSSASRVCLQRR